MTRKLIIGLLLLLVGRARSPLTYYVNSTDVACNAGNPGTNPALPFCLISTASAIAAAGDTISALAGSYDLSNTPTATGTAGNYITYDGNNRAATVRNFALTGKAYIKVNGFTVTNVGMTASSLASFVVTGTDHVWITNNAISETTPTNNAIESIATLSTHLTISGNTFQNIGSAYAGGTSGGRRVAIAFYADDVLVDGNTGLGGTEDFIRPRGSRIVIRGNTFRDTSAYDAPFAHVDFVQADCQSAATGGPNYILVEGNTVINQYGPQTHFGLINTTANCAGSRNVIVRYNKVNGIGEGFWLSDLNNAWGSYHKVYNNTVLNAGAPQPGSVATIGGEATCATASSPSNSPNIGVVPNTNPGTGYVAGTGIVTTTSGAGAGMTVNIFSTTGSVTRMVINNYGSGYAVNDTVTAAGGTNATVLVCALENTTTSTNLNGIVYSDVRNNIFYNAVTDTGSPVLYTKGVGQIGTLSLTAGGAGYSTATVRATSAATGVGSLATGDVTAVAGAVTVFTLKNPGRNYAATNSIKICTTTTPGSCADGGATFSVSTIMDTTNTGGYNAGFCSTTCSWTTPFSTETGRVTTDPLVDGTTFAITSASPAYNAGGALTTVAVADTGSGTSLVVADSSYFQYGWGPSDNAVNADWIAVGTVGNIVQISSINYDTHTITLASDIARSDLDSVWLYKNSSGTVVLNGTAPDMGASEVSSGSGGIRCLLLHVCE